MPNSDKSSFSTSQKYIGFPYHKDHSFPLAQNNQIGSKWDDCSQLHFATGNKQLYIHQPSSTALTSTQAGIFWNRR